MSREIKNTATRKIRRYVPIRGGKQKSLDSWVKSKNVVGRIITEGELSTMTMIFPSMTLAADKIILAVGQEQDDTIAALPDHPRLFAGGDRVNGGSTVVAAIASGKRTAQAILDTISG